MSNLRLLSVHNKPQVMENLDVYNYAAIYLSTQATLGDNNWPVVTPRKDPPLEFNCVELEFNYENFVPNKTILDGYNEKLQEFAKLYPEWEDNINERFSMYLWVNSNMKPDGYYKKPVMECSMEEFKQKLLLNPTVVKKYMSARRAFNEYFDKEPDKWELVLEYKDDEKARQDVKEQLSQNAKSQEDDLYGWEWRQAHTLRTLNEGHKLETYLDYQLKKKYGIDIGLIYDQNGQTKGETKVGIEFKNDLKSVETGNCYIELYESRKDATKQQLIKAGAKEEDIVRSRLCNNYMVKSGLLKDDNTKFFVFGPKERMFIIRRDVLLDYYYREVEGKRNTIVMHNGVVNENSNQSPNMINENVGNSQVIYKKNDGTKFQASEAFILRLNKMEELAEDFGLDGVARVLIADGCEYVECPPDKEYQIERERNQYAIDKLKTFGSIRCHDGEYRPAIANGAENHKDNMQLEKKGVHITYTDNAIYDKYTKLQDDIHKLEKKLWDLKLEQAMTKSSGKDTTSIDNQVKELSDNIDNQKSNAIKIANESTIDAFVHLQERRSDGMIKIPLSGKNEGQGIFDSNADRYIHIIHSPHNSKDKDMTYEFDMNALINAVEKGSFQRDNDAGITYVFIPENRTWQLNNEFNLINRQRASVHVNTTIDLEDSDIRKSLSQEYQIDPYMYDNLEEKTKENQKDILDR